MAYKIEPSIPYPGRPGRKASRYPWRDMEIGDSFFVSDEETTQRRIGSAPAYFSIRNPEYKFSVRKVEGGYRVWRIPCKE